MITSHIDMSNVRITSAKNVKLTRIDEILKAYNGDYAKWQKERYPVTVDRRQHYERRGKYDRD